MQKYYSQWSKFFVSLKNDLNQLKISMMKTSLDWCLLLLINQIHRFGLFFNFCLSILKGSLVQNFLQCTKLQAIGVQLVHTQQFNDIFQLLGAPPICPLSDALLLCSAPSYRLSGCRLLISETQNACKRSTIQNIFPTCEITTSVR